MELSIPSLGKVNVETAPDGRWAFQLDHLGHAIDLDFNVDGNLLTQGAVHSVAKFIAELATYDALARHAIRDNYDEGGEYSVRLYVSRHLEQMNTAELSRNFASDDPQAVDPHLFLLKLRLHRIGLYPDHEARRAIFDYKFDGIPTDYVIAVSFDPAGNPVAVDMESWDLPGQGRCSRAGTHGRASRYVAGGPPVDLANATNKIGRDFRSPAYPSRSAYQR